MNTKAKSPPNGVSEADVLAYDLDELVKTMKLTKLTEAQRKRLRTKIEKLDKATEGATLGRSVKVVCDLSSGNVREDVETPAIKWAKRIGVVAAALAIGGFTVWAAMKAAEIAEQHLVD